MTIRSYELRDAEAVADILVEGWRWAYKGIIPDEELAALDVQLRKERLEQGYDPTYLNLVVVDENDLALACAREQKLPDLVGYDCEIGSLYVHPKVARMGLGRRLVGAMAEQFIARGSSTLAIHTLTNNRVARPFYESLGGKLVHEDMWREYPAVWYGWTDLAQLIALINGN